MTFAWWKNICLSYLGWMFLYSISRWTWYIRYCNNLSNNKICREAAICGKCWYFSTSWLGTLLFLRLYLISSKWELSAWHSVEMKEYYFSHEWRKFNHSRRNWSPRRELPANYGYTSLFSLSLFITFSLVSSLFIYLSTYLSIYLYIYLFHSLSSTLSFLVACDSVLVTVSL